MREHDDEQMSHRDATDPHLLKTVMRHVRWGWITVTFAANILGFAVVGSWLLSAYTTEFEGRVAAVETAVQDLDGRVDRIQLQQGALNTSIAVLETRSEAQSKTLDRIEDGVSDLSRERRNGRRSDPRQPR